MTNVQIKKVNLDPLSYTSVPVRLLNSETETEIASATAFFFKQNEKYFLITNWHNVTGFSPETEERIGENLASPTAIEFPFLSQKTPCIKWERRKAYLYKDNKPIWFIHPEFKTNKIDVVAIELGVNDNFGGVSLKAINEINFDSINPRVSDEVFILGFPHCYTSGGNFPIWKRGSIASEPDIDLDNVPKILVVNRR